MGVTIENIRFYTVPEVSKKLNITSQTTRIYIKQGKLKGQKIGRPYLISEKSLQGFLGIEVNTTP